MSAPITPVTDCSLREKAIKLYNEREAAHQAEYDLDRSNEIIAEIEKFRALVADSLCIDTANMAVCYDDNDDAYYLTIGGLTFVTRYPVKDFRLILDPCEHCGHDRWSAATFDARIGLNNNIYTLGAALCDPKSPHQCPEDPKEWLIDSPRRRALEQRLAEQQQTSKNPETLLISALKQLVEKYGRNA